jgi:hypothetical protein
MMVGVVVMSSSHSVPFFQRGNLHFLFVLILLSTEQVSASCKASVL